MTDNVLIIAEAGVNHNGDLEIAKELVAAAAEAGADIVKFQTFKAKNLVTETAEKAQYQKDNCGAEETQFQMLKKLEMSDEMHHEIIACCKAHNIEFLSTAFDLESLDFLSAHIGLKRLKIPSGDITNGPLIHAHARTNADIILSTGMSNLGEVEAALAVIAHGYCAPDETINSLNDCYQVLATPEAQQILKEKVVLLHCTSSYPTPVESVNLKAMDTLHDAFGLSVGYSDHTAGIVAPIAAVAKGAVVIEKHFTLSHDMEGPDHKASLEPADLKSMVDAIRETSIMMGNGIKAPDGIELSSKAVARKSLIATQDIAAGDVLGAHNMTTMRPGTGICAMQWWDVQQKPAKRDYRKGDLIE